MTEPGLHQLERQLEAAVDAAVNAPARVEMAQSYAGRYISPMPRAINYAGGDQRGGFRPRLQDVC